MPFKSILLITFALQAFSVMTFFSLWAQPWKETYETQRIPEVAALEHTQKLISILENSKSSAVDIQHHKMKGNCLPNPNKDGTCSMYIMGDTKKIQPLKNNPTGSRMDPYCRLTQLLKNCHNLRTAHGYITDGVSKEEKDFPLAFAIKLHRDPEQAEQVLRTLYRPHNVYCIYVDGKAHEIVYQLMLNISKCFPNVHVIAERINVIYSSFAHVQSELQCMKQCTKSSVRWKYYINLTGQEFPLRTNLEIVRILKSLNGANDIETYNHPIFLRWRFEKRFKLTEHSLVETSIQKPPFKYKILMSKGSAYGSFSRQFVDFILKDDIAQELISWLNDTYSPEENIWATLNTLPWAPGGYDMEVRHRFDNFLSRAVIWEEDKVRCEGRYVRGVCVFGRKDLTWLTSRPQLFANKFNYKMDNTAIDCLENVIRNRTFYDEIDSLNWYYYRNLPHAKYYLNRKGLGHKRENLKDNWLRAQANQTGNGTVEFPSRKENSNSIDVLGGTISMYKVHGDVL